jgi:hypothetical protein
MSIWSYEDDSGNAKGLVSIREAAGIQTVQALTSMTESNRTWTSTVSGQTYALDWTIQLADGSSFDMTTIKETKSFPWASMEHFQPMRTILRFREFGTARRLLDMVWLKYRVLARRFSRNRLVGSCDIVDKVG